MKLTVGILIAKNNWKQKPLSLYATKYKVTRYRIMPNIIILEPMYIDLLAFTSWSKRLQRATVVSFCTGELQK